MSKKNLLMLSLSVMFGAALVAPSAALAQFGPPPGPPPALAGPPPGLGAGGPPPGLGAGGPPSVGVGRRAEPITVLRPSTTTASILVPPRSMPPRATRVLLEPGTPRILAGPRA